MGIIGVNGNKAVSNDRAFPVNSTFICYGIGGHFLVRCDVVTVTGKRRHSNGQRQGMRELKMENNSKEVDGLKRQTDRDGGGTEEEKRANSEKILNA